MSKKPVVRTSEATSGTYPTSTDLSAEQVIANRRETIDLILAEVLRQRREQDERLEYVRRVAALFLGISLPATALALTRLEGSLPLVRATVACLLLLGGLWATFHLLLGGLWATASCGPATGKQGPVLKNSSAAHTGLEPTHMIFDGCWFAHTRKSSQQTRHRSAVRSAASSSPSCCSPSAPSSCGRHSLGRVNSCHIELPTGAAARRPHHRTTRLRRINQQSLHRCQIFHPSPLRSSNEATHSTTETSRNVSETVLNAVDNEEAPAQPAAPESESTPPPLPDLPSVAPTEVKHEEPPPPSRIELSDEG